MPASPVDSAIYRDLFGDAEISALFTDSAEVRAMMLVEGALAKVQGTMGMIPEVSGAAIHRAAMEQAIDPSVLADGAGGSGVPVPALVDAMRKAMEAPEHAQYVHWAATSQDIVDTGLALRLRQALTLIEGRLDQVLGSLAAMAEAEAETPITGRTWGQAAVVTSFGAVVAGWGWPLLNARQDLSLVRERTAVVSLSGAAGTNAAMGESAADVRAGMAKALNLSDPERSTHATRDGVAALAAWLTAVCTALGRIGEDVVFHAATGIGEVALGQSGGSSTMPQKANPVAPSALTAIAHQVLALNTAMQGAAMHRQQRDGAAWMTEWLSLPQMVILTGRATLTAQSMLASLEPRRAQMSANIGATNGMMFAEALSFALAKVMPRPEAQATIKSLVATALESGRSLGDVAKEAFPDVPLESATTVATQLGAAPDEARRFAKSVDATK